MGLFSWIATTKRKSEAASLIQQYFEIAKRNGSFPGDPAWAATKLTELACNRVPNLPNQCKGLVLAAAVLAVVVMEDDLEIEDRDRCAMALFGMLTAAARLERHLHSYEDQAVLGTAKRVFDKFREVVPEQPWQLPEAEVVKSSNAAPSREPTAQDREKTLNELIRVMKA